MTDPRALLFRAAVGFCLVPPTEPELRLLHRWLDNRRGIGDIVTGMKRQGYEISLGDHGSGQWIATFYQGHGGYEALNAAGTAQAPTPWRAVQGAAWLAPDEAGGQAMMQLARRASLVVVLFLTSVGTASAECWPDTVDPRR